MIGVEYDFDTLVIGSLAGLALTGAVLSFQVLTDGRTAAKKTLKLKKGKVECRYYHGLETNIFFKVAAINYFYS